MTTPLRVLYIAVHSHVGWGAEYWVNLAFQKAGVETIPLDYRSLSPAQLSQRIRNAIDSCELLFLQRGEKVPPALLTGINRPIVFWSTEPLQRNHDVDHLLKTNLFDWVFLHTPDCLDRVAKDFPHLLGKVSVLHNGVPSAWLSSSPTPPRRFAIFNRSLSWRRRWWLWHLGGLCEVRRGRFGAAYLEDLRTSSVSVNIHYSHRSRRDVETGIFEALAAGCAVVSERLHPQAVAELDLAETIWQVDSPREMRRALKQLRHDEALLREYRQRALAAAPKHTWEQRVKQILTVFRKVLS